VLLTFNPDRDLRLPFSALLVVTGIIGIGCHSVSHSSGTPRPTPTADLGSAPPGGTQSILPPGVLQTLRRYALTDADVTGGFTAGSVLEIPNEQAASDYADPLQAAAEIQQTGRAGGIGQQVFAPPGNSSQIGVSIELFSGVDGAKRWASAPPNLPAGLEPTLVKLQQPPGEGASAIHWKQGSQAGYVVNFSRDRVAYGVGVSAPAGQESLGTALDIARRIDQRAKTQTH
jgi:hypothetical protein